MVYMIVFNFRPQINLMQFLEELKVGEISFFTTFDTLSTSSFDTKCVHYTMETPNSSW
jgi:hypothetical protein